jgi:hypothetical protein
MDRWKARSDVAEPTKAVLSSESQSRLSRPGRVREPTPEASRKVSDATATATGTVSSVRRTLCSSGRVVWGSATCRCAGRDPPSFLAAACAATGGGRSLGCALRGGGGAGRIGSAVRAGLSFAKPTPKCLENSARSAATHSNFFDKLLPFGGLEELPSARTVGGRGIEAARVLKRALKGLSSLMRSTPPPSCWPSGPLGNQDGSDEVVHRRSDEHNRVAQAAASRQHSRVTEVNVCEAQQISDGSPERNRARPRLLLGLHLLTIGQTAVSTRARFRPTAATDVDDHVVLSITQFEARSRPFLRPPSRIGNERQRIEICYCHTGFLRLTGL